MIISTTDPVSLVYVQNPESHPFVIEGEGDAALKIYFENEENRAAYLGLKEEHSDEEIETNLENSVKGSVFRL
ncbi:hypothetical protein [Kaarinaea lacus]